MANAQREPELPRTGGRVYRSLKDGLMKGEYRSGHRLNVDELTEQLSVSRQPIYDAFKRLSSEGFLVVRPNVGCTVAAYEMSEIRDYFQIFAAVEGTATALAAERRQDAELVDLRRLHAQIGGLKNLDSRIERGQAYRVLNRSFHSMIHQMCESPLVETMGAGMYDRADFFIYGSSSDSPLADQLDARQRDHAAILAAVEAADPAAAREAAFDHIFGTASLIEAAVAADAA